MEERQILDLGHASAWVLYSGDQVDDRVLRTVDGVENVLERYHSHGNRVCESKVGDHIHRGSILSGWL